MNNISLSKKIKLAFNYPQTALNMILDTVMGIKIPPFPRIISLFVTNACNLNCPMCLNALYRRKHLQNSSLKIENAKKILPELKKYEPLLWFSGGEPLLNPDTLDIIKLFSKAGLCTAMTTNAFLLENSANKIARSGLDFISLSLDSNVATEHDRGRGMKGSFDRLMAGLKSLQKVRKNTGKPINIKINTIVRKDNFYKLSRMYDFIDTLGIDEWKIQHISYLTPNAYKDIQKYIIRTGIGDAADGVPISNNKYFTLEEIKVLDNQLDKVKQKSKTYHTLITIEPKINNLTAYYQGEVPSKESSCTCAFNQLALYENGKITTGCLAWKIGDLSERKTIKEMWDSDEAKYFRSLILTKKIIPPCFRCCGLNYIFKDDKIP